MSVPSSETELFHMDDTRKIVLALGIQQAFKPEDLHIYINGNDIMKTSVVDAIVITGVNQPKTPAAQPTVAPQQQG